MEKNRVREVTEEEGQASQKGRREEIELSRDIRPHAKKRSYQQVLSQVAYLLFDSRVNNSGLI